MAAMLQRWRVFSYLLLAVGLTLFIVACGDDATPTPTQTPTATPTLTPTRAAPTATPTATATPTPTAAAIYQAMGAKMGSINSFHLLVAEVSEGEEDQFEIDIVLPDQVHFSGTDTEGTFELLNIGDQSFVKFPGFQGWLRQSPEEVEDFGDTIAFISALYTQVADLSYIGQDVLDGVSTHHVRGTVSGAILRILEPADEDDSATVDFWVGVDDSRLYRARFVGSPSGDESDANFSAFDVPVALEAPTVVVDGDVFDLLGEGEIDPQVLGDLLSILPVEAQDCAREHVGEDTYNSLLEGTKSLEPDEQRVLGRCLSISFGLQSVDEVVEILTNAPPQLLDCVREAIGQEALGELMSGTRIPTFDEADRFLSCFEGPPTPSPEDVLIFFDALPANVRTELEAGGWDEQRLSTFLESGASLDELRSFLVPLSDIQTPLLAEQTTFILGAIPSIALSSLADQLGQPTVEELKSGARPPTGGEILVIMELLESL